MQAAESLTQMPVARPAAASRRQSDWTHSDRLGLGLDPLTRSLSAAVGVGPGGEFRLELKFHVR